VYVQIAEGMESRSLTSTAAHTGGLIAGFYPLILVLDDKFGSQPAATTHPLMSALNITRFLLLLMSIAGS
jgi:hypothetical protein